MLYVTNQTSTLKINETKQLTNYTKSPTRCLSEFASPCYLRDVIAIKSYLIHKTPSPSGTTYITGQKCPEEMTNSTRLWIRRDLSLPRDSWQPFSWRGTTQGRLSLPTVATPSFIFQLSHISKSQIVLFGMQHPSCEINSLSYSLPNQYQLLTHDLFHTLSFILILWSWSSVCCCWTYHLEQLTSISARSSTFNK